MSKKMDIEIEEAEPVAPLIPKKRKKKKWPLILIFLVIVGGIVFFFKEPILNGLSRLPVVGKFVPTLESEGDEDISPEELKVKVETQAREIERLEAEVESLENTNKVLDEKNKDLTQYELMYTDFMDQKAAWDEAVAKTNPELFIQQFETVYPDVAERIYQTLKTDEIFSDEQKKLSATISQMDETQAAAALEILLSTDSELVQSIFEGMGTDKKALILSSMTEKTAAQVIKLISPEK